RLGRLVELLMSHPLRYVGAIVALAAASAIVQSSCLLGTECGTYGGDMIAMCGGQCVDMSRDTGNCGSCGTACTAGETCSGGVCSCDGTTCNGVCCPSGSACCDGTCKDTLSDPDNCGKCSNSCGPGQECRYGTCPCTDMCNDACTDTLVDPSHC